MDNPGEALALWALVGADDDNTAPAGAEDGAGEDESLRDWAAAGLFPKRDWIKLPA